MPWIDMLARTPSLMKVSPLVSLLMMPECGKSLPLPRKPPLVTTETKSPSTVTNWLTQLPDSPSKV